MTPRLEAFLFHVEVSLFPLSVLLLSRISRGRQSIYSVMNKKGKIKAQEMMQVVAGRRGTGRMRADLRRGAEGKSW